MSSIPADQDANLHTMTSNLQANALASSLASLLTKSVLHPIDTIKSRIQVYLSNTRGTNSTHRLGPLDASSASVRAREPPAYQVFYTWRAIRRQYENKWGLTHLYSGLSVRLLLYIPYQTLYMTAYNTTHDVLRANNEEACRRRGARPSCGSTDSGDDARRGARAGGSRDAVEVGGARCTSSFASPTPVMHTMAAVLAAECAACVIRVPMEAMKTRIQVNLVGGIRSAAQQLRRHGMHSLFRLALVQTAMHDIPYSMVQWLTYESLRPWMQSQSSYLPIAASNRETWDGRTGTVEHLVQVMFHYRTELVRTFFSGGFSGLVAAVLTAPLDNIRTRVLVRSAREPGVGVGCVVRDVYMHEGVMGFMRGSSMRVLWITTNMALYFPLYELLRRGCHELLLTRCASMAPL